MISRLTPRRVWAARLLAMAADAIQIAIFPLFAGGASSPWNDALDLVVAAAMTALVGWHWAFLPSLFAELIPGLDLVPTWTAAAFFVTRRKAGPPAETERRSAIDVEVVRTEKDGALTSPSRTGER